MPGKKREREEAGPANKPKKIKYSDAEPKSSSKIVQEEIDFPRGGGSSFTPLEYKAIRAEAIQEANAELVFEDSQAAKKLKSKRKLRETEGKAFEKRKEEGEVKKKGDTIRVEHLNYKRLVEGMKVLGQIIAIQPLALIVSLPCQLFGHVPITQISVQLTKQLEAIDEMNEDESVQNEGPPRHAPELFDIFRVGQYVRTVVTAMRPAGASARDMIGFRGKLDETERACQRVELSLIPEHVNTGVSKQDLTAGFVLPAAVQSVEDHGYIFDLGVSSISGFLSFKDAQKANLSRKLAEGHVIEVCISKVSDNGRTCTVAVDSKSVVSSFLSQTTSVTSVLPGTLVQALVTAVLPAGLNVQLLGFFEGTVDVFHLPTGDKAKSYKLGQKIKARILWEMTTSDPRQFALSLLHHVLDLDVPRMQDQQSVQDAFPVGTILDAVRVARVEAERGLVVEIRDGILGYVHIRHVSDEHIPSLSPNSGRWKLETVHRARVIGFQALDGILQLSFQESVLAQKFLQVADVEVGELLKATVKKLTSTGLFVSISGNVDGVIWPNHYADITLKHPQKRFKEGATVKCRVLVVDPDRKRVALTAKKTLVESDLPILTRPEDVQVGAITHAVVFKILEKALLVEFYNNLRAQVPIHEASETLHTNLSDAFPVGKPVKVRITRMDLESGRIVASIRQASTTAKVPEAVDVHGVEVGETVHGPVQEIHKDQVVVKLQPSGITALISVSNLANSRETTASQLRTILTIGEELSELIVLSQNPDKGIVIVSKRPKSKSKLSALPGNEGVTTKSVEIGHVLSGRVTGHGRRGSMLHITNALKGFLHPTDTCDDYNVGTPFPSVESVIEGVVVGIDKSRKHVAISSRPSRLRPAENIVPRDREISSVEDLKVGDAVRGFVKNIVEHGLFVSIGRTVDARVQIRELFDEFVKDWKPRFEVNQLVQGKIARVDVTANQVELSLRSGPLEKRTWTLGDFSEGQKVDAIIKKKEKYGVFLEIKDTKISGLCHKSEISDNPKADVGQALHGFREGDPVRAVILTLNLEKQRISFGLKPSYFDNEDFELHDAEAASTSSSRGDVAVIMRERDSAMESGSEDDEVVQMDTEAVHDEHPVPIPLPVPVATPALQLQGGFSWSDDIQNDNKMTSGSESDSDSESVSGLVKKSKNKKKKKVIEYDLTGDLHTRQPESTADFERLLLSSPNSSYLWIQYMSFQLRLSEIEKATEIGKRALKTINFREEQEKLNIWIALLNLENKYGTDESLETLFKDAARHNDSKTIHLRLASIFDETERHDRATEQFQRTCKKFGKSSKVWTLFGEYHLRRGDLEAARLLLPRSLQSLEKRKHLKTISKFAHLEFKLGDPERGRTIFEGIVASHPKRWDIWSIYVDMEATKENIQSIRNIFDRILSLKMTSHKAKAFFKKWLTLEKQLGDEDGENSVKTKAVEWTQKAIATGA